jgi:hypothetical protein
MMWLQRWMNWIYDVVATLDELIALGHMFRRRKSWTLEPVCLVAILMRCAAVGVSASPQRDLGLLRIRFDQR